MKIRCVVVDDEPTARKLVVSYVLKTPMLELVDTCTNGAEVIEVLQEKDPDLIFLDIQMPELTGMELAKRLINGPKVIFTTAFDKYALQGYKVNAVDYLLKPFSYDEFLEATQKAKVLIEKEKSSSDHGISKHNDFIMVKADYKMWQIPLDDILFIEGVKDYVKIHRKSIDKVLMPLISMKNMENRLEERGFLRIHRSYMVNLNAIEVVERNQVVFGDVRITVSDLHREKFQAFLKNRSID